MVGKDAQDDGSVPHASLEASLCGVVGWGRGFEV